jgi:GntP family gluconate:H+ symporter
MILSALLVPVALLVLMLVLRRFALPTYLVLIAVVVGYGLAADMTIQSIGKSFGLGFAATLEQTGLLVIAGALVRALMPGQPLPGAVTTLFGAVAGLGGSAAGGLALLQPVAAGTPRRAAMMALTLLAVHGLLIPSPLAVAAGAVLKAELLTSLSVALRAAAIAVIVGWLFAAWCLPAARNWGQRSLSWLAIALPIGLLVVQSVAQMPTEPLGKGGAREFYTGISHPLILAVIAIVLALVLTRRPRQAPLADTSWAPLLLTIAAAGGFARVIDETGTAELIAEYALDPRLGLLAPFLAAATVKTLQGNSLSAVLTASGMIEPLLPALGLDSATGRALAAAAAGAGSIAICHINDPFFWIAAHISGLTPMRALRVISLGSLAISLAALGVLALLHLLL